MPKPTRKHGPFTWERNDNGGCECWDLVLDAPDLSITCWALKNYGGKAGPGFAGWKLVSGGPFDSAGAYNSLEAALEGVTPWLIREITEEAEGLQAKATRMLMAIGKLNAALKA